MPHVAGATPFTTTVPNEGLTLPGEYPQAGGVAYVMIGANGNVLYQYVDSKDAFQGFQYSGSPAELRGNPFSIDDPIPLDCGPRGCTRYFGGSIDRIYVRISAEDSDTHVGGFDFNDIDLMVNGISIGNWSDILTERTNISGTRSYGFEQGFGNNTFNTGWFSSSNPVLMDNILSGGQATAQVFDADPNDNYWNFRRGSALGNDSLATIAPGYELEKTASTATYSSVGQQITYTYTVTNIGTVDIFNVQVADDRIANVTCDKTTIPAVTDGGSLQFATCTGVYSITQADLDAQSVTNIAQATGQPEYGTLGTVSASATITAAVPSNPVVEVAKTADRSTFTAAGEVITYTYVITNAGDVTLTDIALTDDKIAGTICTTATLVPQAPNNTTTCTATYTVTQLDVDAFAINGTPLVNVATVTAQDANGGSLSDTANAQVNGPAAAPALTILKTAIQPDFDMVDDLIQFEIAVRNTGNVTWPTAPAITDPLVTDAGGSVGCPTGPVAPNAEILCTASYRTLQGDLDAEGLTNTATANITVAGVPATGTSSVTVPAVTTTGLGLVKRLPAGAETTFDAAGDAIAYEYLLTNTGTQTLFNPTVSDDKVAVTCAEASIAPGASIVCTSDAPYSVTQGDVDAGAVTNVASASTSTQNGAIVDSPTVDLTVNAVQTPSMTLLKEAPNVNAGNFRPGRTVTYTFTVTNTGNTTLTDPVLINDSLLGAPFECDAGTAAPTAQITCSRDYTLTGADVAAGFVTNRASATSGPVTSNEDTVTISDRGAPELSLTKAPDPVDVTFSALTDTIDYLFTVENTGTTTITDLQPITVDDPKAGPVTCAQPATFNPGDTFTCSVTYSGITQAEIDAGLITNTATARFTDPNGDLIVSNSATATVPSSVVPAMSLTKTGPASFGIAGTTVTYTFALTNDTAQTISTAQVTDVKIPALSCGFTDIAPFDTVTCTGDYTVSQEDVDRGTIDNVANATGRAPTGQILSATASETVLIDPAAQVRALSLDKTANVSSFAAVGDVIRYNFAVANTGTLTLRDIEVTDPQLGFTCIVPQLAPQTTDDTTCIATHQITQADIDAGTFYNTATATAPLTPPSTSSIQTPGPVRTAAFTLAKTANDTTEVQAGQTVTYTHVVTNTGNTTLTDITLTDRHTSAAGTTQLAFAPSNTIASLAPGQTATVTTRYLVTQDDIDAGADLTNTVSGTATPPAGLASPTASASETVDVQDAAPALSVAKTEDDGTGTYDNLPSTESFSFVVTNDGNVTLTGFTLTDNLTGFSCVLPDIPVGGATTQCANAAPLSTTHTITQADIDRAQLLNTVTVTDGALTATDSVLLTGPPQVVAISMVKTAKSGADYASVGDQITYDYVVTNDSNITLRGLITVADDQTAVTCPRTPAAGLAPNGTLTCTATYTVDQADLDRGFVTNVAEASVTQTLSPGGPVTVTSGTETETVAAAQAPSLGLSKIITPGTPTTFRTAGSDSLSYQFTITNTGNVTIPAPISVDDDQIGTGLTCGTAPLAPAASVTCTHVWTATQEAIDAGQITNTASPVATFDSAPVPATDDSYTAVAVQRPELTIVKSYDLARSGAFAAPETQVFNFLVTNTGNTTVTTEPVITDVLIDPSRLTIDAPFSAGGLAPGQSVTYTGEYDLTLADIQLGSVTNTATAASDGTTSSPDSVTTPEDVDPALSITKSADVTSFAAVNDPIVYTYTVTNTSEGATRPAFANAITVTDDKFPGATISCDPTADNQLIVGESTTCTATYLVTQADLDAGEVVNSALAETTFAGQQVLSPAAQVTVAGVETPQLTLTKDVIAGPDPAALGDVLTFRMVATNSGNQTLFNVMITDPEVPDLTCTVGGTAAPTVVNLAPSATLVCEGPYRVLQSDVDAQVLSNTASTMATNPDGVPVSATATDTHPVDPFAPAMRVVKTLTSGEPGSDYSSVGEAMVFQIAVTNTGNITLDDVAVTDSLVPGSCEIGTLAPDATNATCTFTHIVTQADIDRGFVDNTATATALPRTAGSDPIAQDGSLRSLGPLKEPAFALVKEADLTSFSRAGTTITYSYTVANTGNVTLTAPPSVTDDRIASVSCPALPLGGLPPSEFITCSATYQTTQADVDAGGVTNIAHVSSEEVPFDPANPGTAQDSATVPAQRAASVVIGKQASPATGLGLGDVVTYTYTVENTGNVTLTDVTLDDQHSTASGTSALAIQPSAIIAQLPPDAIVTRTAQYTVTQADIDAGAPLTNIVTLTARSPDGTTPTARAEASVTPQGATPALTTLKTVTTSTGQSAGDTVTFAISVENTGNVTLDGLTLTETLRRLDGTMLSPAPTPVLTAGDGGTLSPAEVWTYRVSHTLTQADVDAGGVSNSVTARATAPSGAPVSDISDTGTGTGSSPTPFVIPPLPAIETTKVVAIENTGVGERVTFRITLTNTGNVTLTDVAVSEDILTRADGVELTLTSGPSFAGSDDGSGAGTLKVGEIATYLATYDLTQADVDAGGISNVAMGTGTPPSGAPVTDEADVPARVTIAPLPAITMEKVLSGGGPAFDAVGDVLSYDFIVTNTGNVTLTDQITITDPLITDAGGTVTCPAPPLAPLASLTCSGSYVVTQADIDAGAVTNTATAQVAGALPATDSTTTPARQRPALGIVKEAEDVQSAQFIVGAEVAYTYTVTNTGNLTLTDPVTVSDNLIADVICPALPEGGLAPAGQMVCTAVYTVTATDVQLASVTNLASASSGDIESPLTSATIPADGTPALTLEKAVLSVTDAEGSPRADGAFSAVGDLLTYTFTLTNSGEVSFATQVTVTDDHFPDPIACFVPDGANPDLTPGESVSCQATYSVTQEDLDAAFVFNTAFAETTFGVDPVTPVTSPPVTAEVPAATAPDLQIVKAVDNTSYAAVDDTLTYTFLVTNTGNQTLNTLTVTDRFFPDLDCTQALLEPAQSFTCSAVLNITQDDIDAGELVNVASVEGFSPSDAPVRASSDVVISVGPAGTSALVLEKSASPDPFGAVGSSITFGFAVTNDGPFTMQNLVVTDPLIPEYSCTIPRLAVGDTDAISCFASYTVTQDDVDRGTLTNTARVTGESLLGNSASAEDSVTLQGPVAEPALEVLKTALVPSTTLGQEFTFTLQVANTGNVTLTAPALTDRMTRIGSGRATYLTTPFGLVSGDTDEDGFLDVTETWVYTATYILTQSDLNAGGVANTATATAQAPDGTTVSDVSDDGTAANGDDNPTLVPVTNLPVLDVTKTLVTGGDQTGDTVTFRIEAANRGNVDILSLGFADTLSRADGTDISAGLSAPTRVAPNEALTLLQPAQTVAWTIDYTLTQSDVDAGGIFNSATVSGAGELGDPVSDLSDNADDSDGNVADDPTVLAIAPAAGLDVVKTVTSEEPTGAGDLVSFAITATNTGNVSLSDITLVDTFTRGDGTVLTPDSITPDPATGESLAAGEALTWVLTYTLTQDDVDDGLLSNTAEVTGLTPLGLPVSDVSDNGDDTDGNVTDDPTLLVIPQDTTLLAAKTASTPERIVGSLLETTFTITVENAGNVTHRGLSVVDDMTVFVAPATLEAVSTPVVSGLSEGGANPAYDGVAVTETLAEGTVLHVGETLSIDITVRYDIAGGSPAEPNTAMISSDVTSAALAASVTLEVSEPDPDILVSKSVTSAGPYRAGSVVEYEITFTNRNTTPETDLSLVDLLPAGLTYLPDSATLNGSATPAPVRTGRRLSWSGVDIGGGETVTVTLSALLLDGAGTYVNTAFALDAQGVQVSNTAEAEIMVAPEPVFDCTDVIGKVFDDVNGNGYQDPPPDARAPITDQSFVDGKFTITPEVIDQQARGEPGLAGVRLVTVRGDIITTDAYGRFSVPCAELPGRTGANFTLKLDDRSLPTGYRVTSENPRTLRLTAGIMAEMNFGATLANLVDIDLLAAAFEGGTDRPSAGLVAGVDGLVAQIASTPSVLRLTYYTNGESVDLARARLAAVEALIRDRWRGTYRLAIETTIARAQ